MNHELLAALRSVQDDARGSGLDKISKREIDAEIKAYRRERPSEQK